MIAKREMPGRKHSHKKKPITNNGWAMGVCVGYIILSHRISFVRVYKYVSSSIEPRNPQGLPLSFSFFSEGAA